jgi:hypothetical protein
MRRISVVYAVTALATTSPTRVVAGDEKITVVASYIFATPDERTFPERYRILRAEQKISDIHELDSLTGVVSASIASAFFNALTEVYSHIDMIVGRANGSSWSAVENNYYGLGLDYDFD